MANSPFQEPKCLLISVLKFENSLRGKECSLIFPTTVRASYSSFLQHLKEIGKMH